MIIIVTHFGNMGHLSCIYHISQARPGLMNVKVQSAFHEKVPAGGGGLLGCGAGGTCTGGWTKGLLLVENSMTHQGVTLLHTD
jgi:hypothetical protein